ncbi:hypothetical protein RJ640_002509 [Escallonia rubra]|uniref:C2 domain-containing protein n=1 Tax=Escallonia rubra TaxID=112253 RepID=A0AA88QRL8_9ASTE|nr:hypothetical protein RJ640_002509 [Escallonia rubra]
MECRKFEITLIFTIDLENLHRLCKMKVYARISLGNDPNTEKGTPIDQHSKTNPVWDYSMSYVIEESMVQHHGTMVVINLYCKRKLRDRYIGKGNVKSQGALKFSFRFRDKFYIDKLLLAESIRAWSHSAD